MLLRRRKPEGLLGGMTELPGTDWLGTPLPAAEALAKQVAWLETQIGDGFVLPMGFSAVDADLVPILTYISMQPEGAAAIAAAPKVGAYLKRLQAYPAMAKSAPPPR